MRANENPKRVLQWLPVIVASVWAMQACVDERDVAEGAGGTGGAGTGATGGSGTGGTGAAGTGGTGGGTGGSTGGSANDGGDAAADASDSGDGSGDAGDASDASDSASDGACTDTQSDPLNCGACGHDCLGGDCLQGKCQPFALAKNESRPVGVAVDATHVYWGNAPAAGNGDVRRAPLAGGPPTVLHAYVNGLMPGYLAVRDGYVYWTIYTGTSVLKLPVNGGTPVVVGSGSSLYSAAADATNLYFSDNGKIVSVPLSGGSQTTLVTTSLTLMAGIAPTATKLYFGDYTGSKVWEAPIGGGTPTQVTTTDADMVSVAVDDKYLYWTIESMAGSVYRYPLAGGTAEAIATGQNRPVQVAVDAKAIYWANNGNGNNGTIMRLAKP